MLRTALLVAVRPEPCCLQDAHLPHLSGVGWFGVIVGSLLLLFVVWYVLDMWIRD